MALDNSRVPSHLLNVDDDACQECINHPGNKSPIREDLQNPSFGKRLGFGIISLGIASWLPAVMLGFNGDLALLIFLIGMLIYYLTDLVEKIQQWRRRSL